jgi:hypothetical protein
MSVILKARCDLQRLSSLSPGSFSARQFGTSAVRRLRSPESSRN